MKYLKKSTYIWVLFVIILLIASLFRLPFTQYSEFKSDEGLNLFLATRPLFHHPFPPASLASSAGILNFPLINYLLLPIALFTLYPPYISFTIALLNVLTIGGFFLLFAKYHGKITGFLASIALSLSPWAILYSRKVWAQDFILPLSLPFFLSMYKILEGKKAYWLLFGITCMLLLQIHQVAIVFPLVIFFFLLVKRNIPNWKLLFLGIGLGLIPAIPYVVYQIQFFCLSCSANASLMERFSFHSISSFVRFVQSVSIGNFHTELGDDFLLLSTKFHYEYLFSKVSYVTYILTPIGAYLLWKKEKLYGFFTPACIVTLVLFFLFGIEPLMHYYILLLPIIALFFGYSLSYFLAKKKLRVIGITIIIAYVLSLLLFNYSVLTLLIEKGGFSGDYGSSFISERPKKLSEVQKYQSRPDYQEILLANYVDIDWVKGYMPVGKMLFPYNQQQKNIDKLTKEYDKDSKNPLVAMQVMAYYTHSQNPSWDYVLSIKTKADNNPSYERVSKILLNDYINLHLKHLYESPDFFMLYPEHWVIQKADLIKTVLYGDPLFLTIEKLDTDLGQTDSSCINGLFKQLSCVNQYGSHYYRFSLTPDTNTERVANTLIFRDIISSIRGR